MLQLASSIGNYLYEGICPHCPSTNNALETTNNWIKTTHTFRERVSLSTVYHNIE